MTLALVASCWTKSARQHITRVLKAQKGTVAVAMSGGVDSSVAAMILKSQGYSCVGVFMTNWDSSDEAGDVTCNIDRDREHMREVCKRLEIPAVDVDFVKDYWNDVFVPYVDAYRSGIETPNADVMCNRFIKFKRFKEHAANKLGIRTIATGHYCRTSAELDASDSGDISWGDRPAPRLLTGIDPTKDQSYFLSMIEGESLKNVLFPVGSYQKSEVKLMAAQCFHGLAVLTKRESMGLCFVGKRNMTEFLSNYFTLTPGRYIDYDTGKTVGAHSGKESLTIGQRALIGGCSDRYVVLSLTAKSALCADVLPGDVVVGKGTNHPMLYRTSLSVKASKMNWIAGVPPSNITDQLTALRKRRNRMRTAGSIVLNKDGDGDSETNCDATTDRDMSSTHSSDSHHVANTDVRSNSNSSSNTNSIISVSSGDTDTENDCSSNSNSGGGLERSIDEEEDKIVGYSCECRVRYQQPLETCTVTVSLPPKPTSTSRLSQCSDKENNATSNKINHPGINDDIVYSDIQDDVVEVEDEDYDLVVTISRGVRAATPGQILAFYNGDECLGGGIAS